MSLTHIHKIVFSNHRKKKFLALSFFLNSKSTKSKWIHRKLWENHVNISMSGKQCQWLSIGVYHSKSDLALTSDSGSISVTKALNSHANQPKILNSSPKTINAAGESFFQYEQCHCRWTSAHPQTGNVEIKEENFTFVLFVNIWHITLGRNTCQLTQNKMLNPNRKYFTQQLTSAPLKWWCFLLILPRMLVAS